MVSDKWDESEGEATSLTPLYSLDTFCVHSIAFFWCFTSGIFYLTEKKVMP